MNEKNVPKHSHIFTMNERDQKTKGKREHLILTKKFT